VLTLLTVEKQSMCGANLIKRLGCDGSCVYLRFGKQSVCFFIMRQVSVLILERVFKLARHPIRTFGERPDRMSSLQ